MWIPASVAALVPETTTPLVPTASRPGPVAAALAWNPTASKHPMEANKVLCIYISELIPNFLIAYHKSETARCSHSLTVLVRKNTLAAKQGNVRHRYQPRKLRMSISLIHRFCLRPLQKTLLPSGKMASISLPFPATSGSDLLQLVLVLEAA
jgi:hypothetical protein